MGEARKPWQSIAAANVGRFKRKSRKKNAVYTSEDGLCSVSCAAGGESGATDTSTDGKSWTALSAYWPRISKRVNHALLSCCHYSV
jgi:hypothetical protein